jgi:hypothetical protein
MDSFLNDAGPDLGEKHTTIPEEVPTEALDLAIDALTDGFRADGETPMRIAVVATHHLHPMEGTLHHLSITPAGSSDETTLDLPEDPREVAKLLLEVVRKTYRVGFCAGFNEHDRRSQTRPAPIPQMQDWGGDLELLRSVGAVGAPTAEDEMKIRKELTEAYFNGVNIEVFDEADKSWKVLPKLLRQPPLPANLDHVRIARPPVSA